MDREALKQRGQSGAGQRSRLIAGATIMVVDYSKVNLLLASSLLQKVGAEGLPWRVRSEALLAVGNQQFDFVLMDLEMPLMSGIEATRLLRAAPYALEIPIIAVTAHAFPEQRHDALQAGVNDLLTKPYLPEQNYDIIERWLEKSAEPRPPEEASVSSSELPVFDHQAALRAAGDDESLVEAVGRAFRSLLSEIQPVILSAYQRGDNETLYSLVHKLAGSAGGAGALAVEGCARRLQRILKQKPLRSASIAEQVNCLVVAADAFNAHFAADASRQETP